MAETIKIGGELESTATGNKVVDVANVKDKTQEDKSQAQINADINIALNARYLKTETYNKTELDNKITTPETEYKDYDTYADMLAETEHPNGAIYRVANYNGTQAVTNKYAEYSYDGTDYKLMAVRDHGIDNEPTAGSENLVKSEGIKRLFDSQYGFSNADLDISDEHDNSIVRFEDGDIKTKNFDSSKNAISELEKEKLKSIEPNAQVNDTNVGNCGDENDLEIDDQNENSIVVFYDGHVKTKKFDSKQILKDEDNETITDFDIVDKYNNAIISIQDGYPKTKHFDGEKIKKSADKIPTLEEITKELYETVVVNISDYNNNLMNVYDAITPSKNKHYIILIPEGTYDVSSWFTSYQIENSNETHWSGLILKDYTKLLGVGSYDKVILQWMNPDSATHWDYISTLNTHIWNELENLTVKANNIRYAVHDDPHAGYERHIKVKNCAFIVSGKTSRAWGGGTEGGYDGEFVNCKFIMEDWPNYHLYSQDNYIEPFVLHDYASNTEKDSYLSFVNCRFENPYTDLIHYFPDSWEKITYNSSYEQFNPDKTDYAINDCVNIPNDTDYSYKCLYDNTQLPPYKNGRPCINVGFGASGANKTLYVTVIGTKCNTYLITNPYLSRIMGFGDIFGSSPTLRAESTESKNIIIDIIYNN